MFSPETTREKEEEENRERGMFGYQTKFPTSLVKFGNGCFRGCPKLSMTVDTNSVHFECGLNRAGLRFLRRDKNDRRKQFTSL